MKYKIIGSFILIVFIIYNMNTNIQAINTKKFTKDDMEQTIEIFQTRDENYELKTNYDYDLWQKYGLLVLKQNGSKSKINAIEPSDLIKNFKTIDNEKNNSGEWRYLGTTVDGYLKNLKS